MLKQSDLSVKKVMLSSSLKAEINEKIQRYTNTDENFYLTANMVLNLAKKAKEIFKSSEIVEKRQLLNFLLQNLELEGKKLLFKLKTPFDTMFLINNYPDRLSMLRDLDSKSFPKALPHSSGLEFGDKFELIHYKTRSEP